ncbi:NADAR family protein [Nocardia sp. bgisy118]|uniref:NADAR family protein n=1 Tax=Nocardia sp. bgisy118 TaxID=3413786 RepID=UPI003F4A6A69
MRSVEDLIRFKAAGGAVKYLPFWGHRPQDDGSVGKGCFSQWWPAPFEAHGALFPTAEHYMMWRKALLFGDAETAARVLTVEHPEQAKDLGRLVHGFDEKRWEAERFEIVVAGNLAKFGSNDDLRRFLLGTRDRVLVEASPVDRIWGIGLAADHPDFAEPTRWRGANLLGFALMRVREELRERDEPSAVQ